MSLALIGVENGTVTVDVALGCATAKGARPISAWMGPSSWSRLNDVLYVGARAGTAGQPVGLFKLVDGGKAAVRTPVKLGRSSVSTMKLSRVLMSVTR